MTHDRVVNILRTAVCNGLDRNPDLLAAAEERLLDRGGNVTITEDQLAELCEFLVAMEGIELWAQVDEHGEHSVVDHNGRALDALREDQALAVATSFNLALPLVAEVRRLRTENAALREKDLFLTQYQAQIAEDATTIAALKAKLAAVLEYLGLYELDITSREELLAILDETETA